jgi:hypothetical protein
MKDKKVDHWTRVAYVVFMGAVGAIVWLVRRAK